MGAPADPNAYMTSEPGKVNSNPFNLSTQGGFTNPVNASDYQAIDFTGSGPGQAFGQSQAANLSQMLQGLSGERQGLQQNYQDTLQNYSGAAMQAANQQALSNVRGIGGQYGALGGANSGAAYAAMAEGANAPLYAAQQGIAQLQGQQAGQLAQFGQQNALAGGQMGQSNINSLYDQFSGVVAPQYIQQPSELENQASRIALQNAMNESRKQQGAS